MSESKKVITKLIRLVEGFHSSCMTCGKKSFASTPVRLKSSGTVYNKFLCPDCLKKYCEKDTSSRVWNEKESGLIDSNLKRNEK